MNERDILEKFEQIYNDMPAREKDNDEIIYYFVSKERFKYVLKHLQFYEFYNKKILDIGVSRFTYILKQIYPALNLTALDFQKSRESQLNSSGIAYLHYNMERDDAELPQNSFDIIIFGEVLEHLAVSPRVIFKKLYAMLKKDGILITTTPNFLSFANRIKCLMGLSPLEEVRENLQNPGHFREYSMKELKEYITGAGFEILTTEYPTYWNSIEMLLRLYKLKGVSHLKLYFLYLPFICLRKIITIFFPAAESAISIIARKQG